jgi:hypothetical protein
MIKGDPKPKNPTLLFTTRCLPARNHQRRHLIRRIQHPLLIRHLARRTAIARRDIQCRIAREEIPGSEEQRHGFCRHDGEVFGGGEVRDAEGVPEDDVGIVDGGVAVRDPFRDAAGRLPRCLGDVAAGGEDLVVVVWEVLELKKE